MEKCFSERVYNTLNGFYIPLYNVPGVENAFAAGAPCQKLYSDARDAYSRICDRLGVEEDDDDLEVIFNAFADMTKILCLKMYHYGAQFGKNAPQET